MRQGRKWVRRVLRQSRRSFPLGELISLSSSSWTGFRDDSRCPARNESFIRIPNEILTHVRTIHPVPHSPRSNETAPGPIVQYHTIIVFSPKREVVDAAINKIDGIAESTTSTTPNHYDCNTSCKVNALCRALSNPCTKCVCATIRGKIWLFDRPGVQPGTVRIKVRWGGCGGAS